MKCVRTEKQFKRSVCTCNFIAYHLVHFVSIPVINKCQSGIDFFLLASAQYHSSLRIKYRCPVEYFAEKHYDEKCTHSNVNKGMRFASGTIKSATLMTMGVNEYASTFPMASHEKVRKHVITEKKCGVKK